MTQAPTHLIADADPKSSCPSDYRQATPVAVIVIPCRCIYSINQGGFLEVEATIIVENIIE